MWEKFIEVLLLVVLVAWSVFTFAFSIVQDTGLRFHFYKSYDVVIDGVLYEDVKYYVNDSYVEIRGSDDDYSQYIAFETFEVIGKHTEE